MKTQLTEQEIRDEVNRLAPFLHKVDLPYNLSTYVPELSHRKIEYTRVSNLVKHAFPALVEACGGTMQGKRVLDVACNCGGFSVEAAKLKSEYILGIDIVDHYIEQANFIKRALGLHHMNFKVMDIDNLDKSTVGLFDVVFCFGILYHLENPIHTMRRLASVTKNIMLVDTSVIHIPAYFRPFFRKPLWLMKFPAAPKVDSNSASTSLWRSKERVGQFRPNEVAVVDLLKFLGFSKIEKIEPNQKGLEERYYAGKRVTFLAIR
ncbi:MAG: methyltransferase domain-containing protein [Chloroflexi bacterium]|nr:methyltransferase domain-containing protein [Chloroflexota bacterium]